MEKKISFGFSKTIKKPIITKVETPKSDIQLIDCLESQSIKVIGEIEEVKTPLIIPLKQDSKSLLDRIKKAANKSNGDVKEEILTKPDAELTLDELAAKQLIAEATTNVAQKETKIDSVPLSADNLPLNGEKESTLDDYENVPIEDFGLAMLRGMGWKDGMVIGRNQSENAIVKEPELRPKGLGLGASKLIQKEKPKVGVDNQGKELKLIKGAFIKIIAGMYKGKYGEALGLDEETSRIIVKLTLSKETVSLNEFLVVPITKDEYDKSSKVLNLEQYEEYKQKESKISIKSEKRSSSSDSSNYKTKHSYSKKKKDKKRRSRSRTPPRKHKSSKSRHKRDDYSDSGDSEDRHRRRKHKKKLKKSKKKDYRD